eukprot:SAG11_NODE_515_length_8826_cov_11.352469_3_plen_174_part_00
MLTLARAGCFFEVTTSGDVVWCYLNPVVGSAKDSDALRIVSQGEDVAEYDSDQEEAVEVEAVGDREQQGEGGGGAASAMQELRSAHAEVTRASEKLSKELATLSSTIDAIEKSSAVDTATRGVGDGGGRRLPFCDASSPKFSWANATFRATRLPPDHPALANRTLTPRGTLEG